MSKPNILITGTPGTGKTSTAERAATLIDFKYINVGSFVKEYQCYEGKYMIFINSYNLLMYNVR